MFKPIERKSLSDSVFEQLRDQIVRGEMPPGTALPSERALCDMLEVNRGAVREALKMLEQSRLVAIQHGGATRVLDFRETAGTDLLSQLLLGADGEVDFEVARSIMELRTALGADIARRCAAKNPNVGQALDEVVEQMRVQKRDMMALQQHNMLFWHTLVMGAKNIAYELAYNSIRDIHEQFDGVMAQIIVDEIRDVDAHARIASAVAARDADEAEFLARDLLKRGEERVSEVAERFAQIRGGNHGR